MNEINIRHTKWDTFIREVFFEDNNWGVINITWAQVLFTIKKKYTDEVVLLQSPAIIDWALWKATINAWEIDLNLGVYYYDIEWTQNWTVRTIIKWEFIITFEVTF